MSKVDHYKLRFGPYATPRYRYGRTVTCLIRGKVTITGLTDAPIPWPTCRPRSSPAIILFGALARAVRREANQAVARAWGVTPQTVTKWRAALGVGKTEGTTALRREMTTHEPWGKRALQAMRAKARDPERREKIAAAKRGIPRPPEVIAKIRAANLGRKHTAAARRKMSVAQRKRGQRPPMAGPAWSVAEDELVRTLPAKEAARRTGRSLSAVYWRWQVLGLPDRRASGLRAKPEAGP